VAGIDHADGTLRSARRRCAGPIAGGRVQLHCGDSAHLPFRDAAFDKALAVHTLYFWQPPHPHLCEIRRVLVAGGRLVLAFRPGGADGVGDFPGAVYTFHTPEHVHDLLAAAGFGAIEMVRHAPDLVLAAAHAEGGLDPVADRPQEVTR
jgi:SAM-dependent methyltransferase